MMDVHYYPIYSGSEPETKVQSMVTCKSCRLIACIERMEGDSCSLYWRYRTLKTRIKYWVLSCRGVKLEPSRI